MVHHVANSHEYGGILSVVEAIASYHSDRGSESTDRLTLLHSQENLPFAGENVDTHRLHVPKKSTYGVQDIDGLKNLYRDDIQRVGKFLDDVNPDVVSCNGTFYYPWLLFNAANERNLPLVVTYDGIVEKETSDPILQGMGDDFTDPDRHAYIFPSELARRTTEGLKGVKFSNYLVSPNGVNVDHMDPEFKRDVRTAGENYRIGFVGSIKEVKNPEYLIELSDLVDSLPVDLKVVADMSKMHTDSYRSRVFGELKESGVTFNNNMPMSELSKFYRNDVDMIVSPSHFETFGNVPLEALILSNGQTPALVSDNMGVSEVYRKFGLDNMVVDFEDREMVLEAVRKGMAGELSVSPEVISELKKQYSWKAVLEEREAFRSSVSLAN